MADRAQDFVERAQAAEAAARQVSLEPHRAELMAIARHWRDLAAEATGTSSAPQAVFPSVADDAA